MGGTFDEKVFLNRKGNVDTTYCSRKWLSEEFYKKIGFKEANRLICFIKEI